MQGTASNIAIGVIALGTLENAGTLATLHSGAAA